MKLDKIQMWSIMMMIAGMFIIRLTPSQVIRNVLGWLIIAIVAINVLLMILWFAYHIRKMRRP